MQDLNHILLFKTNISSMSDKQLLQPVLDGHHCIRNWNVDLNDCDCVLRIESDTLSHEQVIGLITDQGYECAELT